MEIRAEEISEIIRKQIKEYGKEVEVAETGTIISIGDGIARIHGLDKAMAGELLEFPGGVSAEPFCRPVAVQVGSTPAA